MNSTMKTARILPVDNWFFGVIAKVDKESWTMTAPLSYLKSNVKQSFGTFSSTAYPLPMPRDVDVTFREALEAEGETLMSWEEWKELNQVWFAKHGIDLDKRAEDSHSDVSESPDPQEEGEEGYAGEDDSQATEEATASYAPGTPSNNEQPKRQLSGGSKHESPPKRLLSKDAIVIEDDAAPETQPAVNLRAKIHSLARSLVDDVTVPPHELPEMQSQPPGSLLPKGNAPSPSQRAELPSQAGAEAPSLPQAQDQPMASQPHGQSPRRFLRPQRQYPNHRPTSSPTRIYSHASTKPRPINHCDLTNPDRTNLSNPHEFHWYRPASTYPRIPLVY